MMLRHITRLAKKAFSGKYLICTNIGISVSLSGCGDVIEQNFEILRGEVNCWDKYRTKNMAISGMTVGFLCHHWYRYLDRILPGRTMRIVIKKVAIDQFTCSPVCIAVFFFTLGYLENKNMNCIVDEIKEKAWKLYAAEFLVWPPAQIFNFYILPTKYRVLYDNVISLGYDIYTSKIKYGS